MQTYFNSQRQPIQLVRQLGRGGEGSVYDIGTRSDLVAKVYHKRVDRDKATKLATMVQLRTERLLRLAAWPVDTLHAKPGGEIAGLLMPRVAARKEIHLLYGPKTRLAEFPSAGWPFLIHTAGNVARAFSVIHDHGHVIGDVNHGNLVVSDDGTVVLIDCDSFQITANGRSFVCKVGVETHTPPELQGQSFDQVVRTANHDAFGLAVLVFQLLFMGRHPFSGQYLGVGDIPLAKAIRESRFAYGANAASNQMRQPPATLSLGALSASVASLFERAFAHDSGRPNGRPPPQEWASALGELSKCLRQCIQNRGHHFADSISSCPWCEIEVRSGTVLFTVVVVGNWQTGTQFDISAIWSQINAVPSPGPLPNLPDKESLRVRPSAAAVQHGQSRKNRTVTAVGIFCVVVGIAYGLPMGSTISAWLVIGATIFGFWLANAGATEVRDKGKVALRRAQSEWQRLEQRWRTEASDSRFAAKLRELEATKKQLQELPTLRLRKLQQLDDERKIRQFHRFLDRYRIAAASIPDIGPSRTAMLQSFGIETAADVTERAVLSVPGFGPKYASRLVKWRNKIEHRFVFNPSEPVNPSDKLAIENEIATMQSRLALDLRNGPVSLRQIAEQIRVARITILPTAEQAARLVAQAEADLASL